MTTTHTVSVTKPNGTTILATFAGQRATQTLIDSIPVDWSGAWPIVDSDGDLTGQWTDTQAEWQRFVGCEVDEAGIVRVGDDCNQCMVLESDAPNL